MINNLVDEFDTNYRDSKAMLSQQQIQFDSLCSFRLYTSFISKIILLNKKQNNY
jgi:hypothetical protein